MPKATANDDTQLYYEETGKGTPLVFVHEFSGDHRSWEPQMRYFSRRYRCVAFNARGYPPSDVPKARSRYSQKIAAGDIAAILRHLKFRKAHIVGCSMGGYSALNFGIHHAPRALSITAVGAGAGSHPALRRDFLKGTEANARRFDALGMPAAARVAGVNPGRVAYLNKDPRGYKEFFRWYEEHSALGLANTQRGLQAKRPTIYQLGPALRRMKLPLFIIAGDEDDSCVEPGVFIKQICASARLWICPATGHTVNNEEPDLFNHMLADFLAAVDAGRWRPRDPRSVVRRLK
jgi:pimeloyl-ACP methyl ester carboxylesterase